MIVVRLGGFAFANTEVPASLPFGGDQQMRVHDHPGGVRVVDMMGAFPSDITWSGLFLGEQARTRALALKDIWRAGKVVPLTWDRFSYDVVVASLNIDFARFYNIPYRITCKAVKDNGTVAPDPADSIDSQIRADAVAAEKRSALQTLRTSITTAATAVREKVDAVKSFVNAGLAEVTAVRNAVTNLRTEVLAAKTFAEQTYGAGLAIGSTIAGGADDLTGFAHVMAVCALAGRMDANLSAVSQDGAIVTTGGADLFRMASETYGDPAEWIAIVAANPGLGGDPSPVGVKDIVVPRRPTGAGGITLGDRD